MMETSRMVVVSGVPKVLPDSRMVDKLTIHFQSSRRSHGGDIEEVIYPTNMDGVAFVTFERAEDAEKVVKKEQQVLMDEEFNENYLLTVFPISRDVFLYVPSATVDLSVFGSDQASLIGSLRSAHRSIRFRSLPQQRKASIEGPFSAVKALREDLMQRASRLQPSSQRYASTKTKQEPASLRSSDEHRDGQQEKTQRKSPVSDESSARGSFPDGNEDNLKAKSRRDISSKHGPTEASVRQVVGEEANARVVSSPSGQDRHPVEAKSAKQTHFLEKLGRCGGMSVAKAREEERLGSPYSSTDYRTDLSGFDSKLNDSDGAVGLHPGNSEDIWVDLYTFKYIQKFHKKELNRCFRDLPVDMSCESVEGSGLMRLSVAEKHRSTAASRIPAAALETLEVLIEFWQTQLRVHEISYIKADKRKLARICDDVNSQFDDVLCILEDSCVKIIGTSENSHLFCRRVKDRLL